MPETQSGVALNSTVRNPGNGTEPPARWMNPSLRELVYPPVPPVLTVVVIVGPTATHVGTAMSTYLMPAEPAWVSRTRSVVATLFCNTGVAIVFPAPSTNVIVADGFVVSLTRTGGVSFCSPDVPAVFVNV